jgi:major type 1 subunit fimbrin (pilin)
MKLGRKPMLKTRMLSLLLAPLLLLSVKAFAGCTMAASPETIRVVLPTFYVDPNIPVGGVIGGKTVSAARLLTVMCTGSTTYRSALLGDWATPSATVPGVYETGLPGIGVKVTDFVMPDRYVPVTNAALPPNQTLGLNGSDIRLLFYRTGEIVPGNFPTGIVARFSLGTTANILSLQITAGGAKIKSCYASSPSITVPLGSHQRSVFNGVGSTSEMKSFNVELTCQGDNMPVNVSFSSSGATSSPEPGVIPLDGSEGSATGVAVKVVKGDGSPVQFDTAETYHTAGETSISIPLRAGYVQTAGTITPGVANTAMTFTITQN